MILLSAATGLFGCGTDRADAADPTTEHAAAETAADDCAWAASVTVTPSTIPVTPVETPVTLDVAITNPTPASCAAQPFELGIGDTGLLFDPRPSPPGPPQVFQLAGGQTQHVALTVTAPASADGGDVLHVDLVVRDSDGTPPPPITDPSAPPAPIPTVQVPDIPFTVATPRGCQVSTSHELMITNLSVVDDPIRTAFDSASRDPRNGVWTFKHLVESMARTPADAPALVEQMLRSFTADETVNGFPVALRPGMQTEILDAWPRTASGALDLAQAPVRLQAIVNRIDLRNLANGDAGEGRFVFAFLPANSPIQPPDATIIFEYKLPAATELDVMRWSAAFHLLGTMSFGEGYNLALQAITEQFARRGARPGHPNGSAINAVRTNEVPFAPLDPPPAIWELREFHLSAATGRLEPSPLELTPDLSFDGTATLASFITANQAAVIADKHTVPATLDGQPFQAGAVFNRLTAWLAPGVDPEARHHFSINTCNGCHALAETGTGFTHLTPRQPGFEAKRSGWLTGTAINDPVTGVLRKFDDLGRRKADLEAIVCPPSPPRSRLREGIHRVH